MRIRPAIALSIALLAACGTLQPVADDPSASEDGGPDGIAPPPSPAVAAYVDEVRKDAPILWLRLDDNPGSDHVKDEIGTVAQSHPLGGRCILGAGGVVPGDKAIRFDGSSCRIEIDDKNAVLKFDQKAAFSIEAWVNADGGDYQHVFTREIRQGGQPESGYSLLLRNRTTAYGERRTTTTNNTSAEGQLGAGTFSHIVLTFDGTTLLFFVDGQARGDPVGSADPIGSFLGTAYIGTAAAPPVGENWFQGVIDEVAVYDKALDPARIQAHHAALSK